MRQLSFDFPLYRVARETTLDEELAELSRVEGRIATHYGIRPPGVRTQIFNGVKLLLIPETSEVQYFLALWSTTSSMLRAQAEPTARLRDAS